MLNTPEESYTRNHTNSILNTTPPSPLGNREDDERENWPTRVSVVIQRTKPFNNLSELITSQPFMDEFSSISDGWICQDFSGHIAACSMSTAISIYNLVAHLIEWGRNNRFNKRLIVLISRSEQTTSQTYSRLRAINRLLSSYFGRKMRVCLVTQSDLLYIRSERNSTDT